MLLSHALRASPQDLSLDLIKTHDTGSISDANSYTFTSVNFGTANTNRRIYIAVSWINGSTPRPISSATIGGITATLFTSYSTVGSEPGVQFIAANVPTGTSGSVIINFGGGVRSCSIYVGVSTNHTIAIASAVNSTAGGIAAAGSTSTSVNTGIVTLSPLGAVISTGLINRITTANQTMSSEIGGGTYYTRNDDGQSATLFRTKIAASPTTSRFYMNYTSGTNGVRLGAWSIQK